MDGDTTKFQSLRGMRDILPEDAALYRQVENAFWHVAESHGFGEIRTPVLEPAELYTRTVGEGSDIVHREMYTFTDRSDNPVSLRPEGTAGVARAFVQHGFASRPQPVKLAYVETMYRYERPQAGRYREHEQFGLEVFGVADASVDAQVILAAWQAYQALGLDDIVVQINSIGEDESKQAIRQAIVDTVSPHRSKLSEDAQRQLDENPLRLLDNKDPQVQEITATVPPAIDQLIPADREHFTSVLEYLDEVGVPYELNPRLVRGLDYYTRTVWEFYSTSAETAASAGGRYDKLIEQVGGRPTPAVGMGNGVDRIVELLKANTPAVEAEKPEIFMVQLGEAAKKLSFGLVGELTAAGMGVTSASGKESIRAQLKHADKLGAAMALIIGQKEAMDGSIIIRDMASGMQETVEIADAVKEIKRRIPSAVKTNQTK
jgi:histidyl-tRNA synthetase